MSKSIFAYDSSDDEEEVYKFGSNQTLDKEELYLYRLGNHILHNKSIVDRYKQHKKDFGYKKSNHSKIVTKYLTQEQYVEKDFSNKALYDLLESKSINYYFYNYANLIDSVKSLYSKIKEIIRINGYKKDKGLINIEKIYCFEVLNKYINNQANDTDLSRAFGIKIEVVKDFYLKLSKAQQINNNIRDLFLYISNNNIRDIVQKVIVEEIKIEDCPAALALEIQFNKEVNVIDSAKSLYSKIKSIIKSNGYKKDKGVIDIEKLYCFEILNKYINGQSDNRSLSDAFGIKLDIVNNFCGKIWNIQGIKDTVKDLCLLKEYGKSILVKKIYTYITSRKQGIDDFNFIIDLACNKKLIDNFDFNFIKHQSDIALGMQNLKFFGHPIDFLSKSILYQKHLKTVIKFRELQSFPNSLNGGYFLDKNEEQIKLENTFTSGLKRTEKVSSLGTYKQIASTLIDVKQALGYISDIELVAAFKDLLTGREITYIYNSQYQQTEAIKVLKDTVYLLFSCEPNRNPSALITNVMFLDLVEKGKYNITDMDEKMPMAMKGAIDVGRYIHSKYEDISKCKAKKNDYGKSSYDLSSPKTIEFQQKEKALLKDWIVENTNEHNITLSYILYNYPDYLENLKNLLGDYCAIFLQRNKSKNLLDNNTYQELYDDITVDTNRKDFEQILDQIIISTTSYKLYFLLKSWLNVDVGYLAFLTDMQRDAIIDRTISSFLNEDKYLLSSFSNTENKEDQYKFLECLNYWYIKPIIEVFVSEGSATKLISHNVISGVYENLYHERHYPFNTIYYTNVSNEFKRINSIMHESSLSLKEIERMFLTIEDIISCIEQPIYQFADLDFVDHAIEVIGENL